VELLGVLAQLPGPPGAGLSPSARRFVRCLVSLAESSPKPDPDPQDPHVLRPPGSGSFSHQSKIVRKTLIPSVLWLLLDFLSMKNDVNVTSKSKKQKKFIKKIVFCWHLEGKWRK
jgi:hypothetical protein